MQTTDFLTSFLKLSDSLKNSDGIQLKLTAFTSWLKELPGINNACILDLLSGRDILKEDLPGHSLITESLNDFLDLTLQEEWRSGPTLLIPIRSDRGESLGLILIKGQSHIPGEYETELNLISDKLQEILEKAQLREKINGLEGFVHLLSEPEGKKISGIPSSGLHLLMSGLNLPLYISDLDGRFTYVNRVFLGLVGYRNLEEINSSDQVFVDPEQRRQELNIIRQRGRVNNFRLSIRRGDYEEISVNDSALLLDSFIFGLFFDVTEFMRMYREFQETLEVQEFLSDRILEAAKILQKTQTVAIKSFARLAEYRDAETGDHLQRIGEYSKILAARIRKKDPFGFRITEEYVNDLSLSSMLHDIGKVGVPDGILLKPGKLSAEEWDIMKNHSTWGWAILHKADLELGEQSFLTLASTLALHHHERYDGTGYPHGLAGEKIPLSARIVSLADVYDALTSRRPYKERWSHEKTVEEITAQRGVQFDPVLVDFFLEVNEEFHGIRNKFPK